MGAECRLNGRAKSTKNCALPVMFYISWRRSSVKGNLAKSLDIHIILTRCLALFLNV